MLRLTLLALLGVALAGCQASMKEDFVDTKAGTTAETPAGDADAAASTNQQVYTGTVELKELTGRSWVVSEGGGSSNCRLRFEKGTVPAGTASSAGANGLMWPEGKAAATGCTSEELPKAVGWQINGDTIELHDESDTSLAFLLMERPDLLLGYTALGHDLVLSHQ
ncbi:hypothetical protein E1162_15635 [Rhodobacteraceae bacterium RKSG542]|uniref:hypothetical protein n=1 Tax=Pseudovibrio flavus TaxID=2529854 RepID=UPI0012BCD2A2|nr:hypothetical protein [Pseudovibrio flavus]MTI18676.1 hypothetical protein [Pseudovibrio flavus]